jgi:hypothetical protein
MIIKSYKEYNQVNEGLKDWVVGALMGLSSLSTIQAQNIKNSDIINQINTTISNTQSIETIADSLSKKEGISKEEAINIINKNAQDVTNKLKDSKSRTTTSTTNYKTLNKLLKNGYAISKIKQDTLVKNIKKDIQKYQNTTIDTISIYLKTGTFFESGQFNINDIARKAITDTMENIKASEGVIIGINIESSTDKQRLSDKLKDILVKGGFEGSNKGLSTARISSIKKYINTEFDVEDSIMSQNILFETGKGEISPFEQDPSSRYVKISMYVVKVDDTHEEFLNLEDDVQILQKFILVKDSNFKLKQSHKKGSANFKYPKIFSGKTKVNKCPVFR